MGRSQNEAVCGGFLVDPRDSADVGVLRTAVEAAMEMKPFVGQGIGSWCETVTKVATSTGQSVDFEFNGTPVLVHPGEKADDVHRRWYMTRRLMGHGI